MKESQTCRIRRAGRNSRSKGCSRSESSRSRPSRSIDWSWGHTSTDHSDPRSSRSNRRRKSFRRKARNCPSRLSTQRPSFVRRAGWWRQPRQAGHIRPRGRSCWSMDNWGELCCPPSTSIVPTADGTSRDRSGSRYFPRSLRLGRQKATDLHCRPSSRLRRFARPAN